MRVNIDNRKRLFQCLIAFMVILGFSIPAYACGFHSSFLARNITPKQWWEYHKHEYISEEEPSPVVSGGRDLEPSAFKKKKKKGLSSEAQGKRRALIAMVVRHLMYLAKTNVMPSEFPNFKESFIPGYIKSFKEILVELGSDAVFFILEAYLWTLVSDDADGLKLARNPKFKDDLIEVLMRIGTKSIATIAECAMKCKGKRNRKALISLMGKILEREPELRMIPNLVRASLKRWEAESPTFLKIVREGDLKGSARGMVLQVWLGLAHEQGALQDIMDVLHDKDMPNFLRADVIDFLVKKEHRPALAEFLKIVLDGEDELFVRRSAIMGLWSLYLYCPSLDMKSVTGELSLKSLITSPVERKPLRIVAIFFLANLEDRSLLDTLVLLLNRQEEDEGVRLAALGGLDRLNLLDRAAGKVDKGILLRRDHIAEYRHRLLEMVSAVSNKENAATFVKIILSEDESMPMRVKSLIALKMLNFKGFQKAEEIMLNRTRMVDQLADFVLEAEAGTSARVQTLRDLEVLYSLQSGRLIQAFLESDRTEEALGISTLPSEIKESLFKLFVKVRGRDSVPLLKNLLENPKADPRIKAVVAAWAGDRKISELKDALLKVNRSLESGSLRLVFLNALESLGERVGPETVRKLLFPKSGPTPTTEMFKSGLRLLQRIGSRDALSIVARCIRPPHEGNWEISALCLTIIAARGAEGRPLFGLVWESYQKSELGDAESRTAFLRCFLRLKPCREICEFLMKKMNREIKRMPVSPSTPIGREASGGAWKTKQILPALHALFLLHAYMENSTELPVDISRAGQLSSRIWKWYARIQPALPKK